MPFIPGSYDSLAGPLSFMARIFGWVALLLVPVGAIWLLSSRVRRFQGREHVFGRAVNAAKQPHWKYFWFD